jgi:septal ring factor EnvC (AmiA/AmiB activator)
LNTYFRKIHDLARLILFVAIGGTLLFTSIQPSNAQIREDNAQNSERLDLLRRQIEQSSEKAKQLEEQAAAVRKEISEIQQKLINSAAEIQSIEDEILEREATLKELRANEIELEERLADKKFEMASTLGAMQRLSIQKTSAVTFKPGEAVDTLRTASLLKVILPELQNRASILQEDLSELNNVREDIILNSEELRAELTRLVIANEDIDTLMKQRVEQQKKLEYSTEQERAKIRSFAENAEDLQDLIEKIEREIALRDEAARRAVETLRDRPQNSTTNAITASTPMPDGAISFASAKGNLPLPARGSINQTFNQMLSTGQRSRGIIVDTRPDATVIAPHDGRIVFAGPFRSYGQLLIIAHGDGYHTLLAGMENINGIVGQWVLKGEPVGQMSGNTNESNSRQKLYVELRQEGKPINPLPWIVAIDRTGK